MAAYWRRTTKFVWKLRLRGHVLGSVEQLGRLYWATYGFGLHTIQRQYSCPAFAFKWCEQHAARAGLTVAKRRK